MKKPRRNLKPIETGVEKKDYTVHILTVILTVLVIIGIVLRFYHLDFNSLWLDEMSTSLYSSGTFTDMWKMMTTGQDYSPPLYFFLTHFVLQAFGGVSEWTLRLLPAVFGVLTIPVMYLVGKEFTDKNTGLIAAGITTFSPFLIYYSQEARAYSISLFLVAVMFLFYLKTTNSEDIKNWLLFGLFAGLSFWAHYYTAIFTVILFMFIIVQYVPKIRPNLWNIKPVFSSIGVALLVISPILSVLVPVILQRTAAAPTYGIQGTGIVYQSLLQILGFSDYIVVISLVLFIVGLIWLYLKDKEKAILLVWLIGAMFAVSIYMSYRIPMLPRYLIFLTIPFSLGIATASKPLQKLIIPSKNATTNIILGIIIFFALIGTPFYLNYYQNYSKEDWRGISNDLKQITVPGDKVVTVPSYIRAPLGYYYFPGEDLVLYANDDRAEGLAKIKPDPDKSIYYIVTPDINAADPGGGSLAWLGQNTTLVKNYGNVFLLKGV